MMESGLATTSANSLSTLWYNPSSPMDLCIQLSEQVQNYLIMDHAGLYSVPHLYPPAHGAVFLGCNKSFY